MRFRDRLRQAGTLHHAHMMRVRVFDASIGAGSHSSSDGAALTGQFCARLGAEGMRADGPCMCTWMGVLLADKAFVGRKDQRFSGF